MPSPPPQPPLPPFLLRAGAFGTLHGGHAGRPEVGLGVPVRSSAELLEALALLHDLKVQVTLLVPANALPGSADDLWRAVRAGHEVAGLGLPLDYRRLEALSGSAVRFWALAPGETTRRALTELQRTAVAPLPEPAQRPAPGVIMQWPPAQVRAGVTELRALGYRPVAVRNLGDLRRGQPGDALHDLYQQFVEDRYAEREGVIDLSQRFDAVLRVAPLDHAPSPLPLPPGTPTAELHVNSTRLVGLASANLTATYKAFQRSLKDVARALETHPRLMDAQAVFAVTLFHAPLEKAGFHIVDLPPLRARWYGLGFRLLRVAYGTTRTPSESTPRMGWMTREAFLTKYGTPRPEQ